MHNKAFYLSKSTYKTKHWAPRPSLQTTNIFVARDAKVCFSPVSLNQSENLTRPLRRGSGHYCSIAQLKTLAPGTEVKQLDVVLHNLSLCLQMALCNRSCPRTIGTICVLYAYKPIS